LNLVCLSPHSTEWDLRLFVCHQKLELYLYSTEGAAVVVALSCNNLLLGRRSYRTYGVWTYWGCLVWAPWGMEGPRKGPGLSGAPGRTPVGLHYAPIVFNSW